MKLITKDDFIDVYQKILQRGLFFILSKLNPNAISRTKSAFDNSAFSSSNWWIIPAVRTRWNEKITGFKDLEYEAYTVQKHLEKKQNLNLLSIGSGVCSHELKFAKYSNFQKITCIDIADNLLKIAQKEAADQSLKNMEFIAKDINTLAFKENEWDIILFHSSLHHLYNIDQIVSEKLKKWLKKDGLLIINEYVGPDRLQFSKNQINYINKGIKLIPDKLKSRFKSRLQKNKFYGSGYLRMRIADPSECVESSKILSAIKNSFEVVEERGYGGNLLMNILKDIAHNFVDETDTDVKKTLNCLFDLEDEYLQLNESDFVFGIYKKTINLNY